MRIQRGPFSDITVRAWHGISGKVFLLSFVLGWKTKIVGKLVKVCSLIPRAVSGRTWENRIYVHFQVCAFYVRNVQVASCSGISCTAHTHTPGMPFRGSITFRWVSFTDGSLTEFHMTHMTHDRFDAVHVLGNGQSPTTSRSSPNPGLMIVSYSILMSQKY